MSFETFKFRLDAGVPAISEQINGGNSSVYKAHLSNGMTLAIKEYVGDKFRIERMISREVASIAFLRNFGIKNIPEIIEIQYESGLIVYRWIDGKEPRPDSISMEELINFCIALKKIYNLGNSFENSIDAVFSLTELESQISNRIKDLEETFSSCEVIDLCNDLRDKLHICTDVNKNTLFTNKTFSVSDLGTHNMITLKSSFYFIDFEFFGLDSVNKMIGDFVLHPKNRFNRNDISRFLSRVSNAFEWDPNELMEILPLLTLKWALIAYSRSFKEESVKGIVEIGGNNIDKSLGTQYLRYFDLAGHIGTNNSFNSFCSFQGNIV
jgi:tRNA A-37 threonylcarbamoyl transferase component Bud32